ncbi:LysR family transcriptional regulator [Arcobacter aquimarinus]|uniref:Transcriptional regulator, LysR family n=1 Tax=Arcobacter aquimarinus TaxID=1315211 RepID=A0AAE7B442_9BACT|nr:LysR family transcriptional regulator [Arcobacter aquimarinus]QKE25650.1 transcriptional regulator, LysR family [Arcobacter aquimarinus]RXI35009.1 LysR family transcriptional regulator [Arcobacter aquimarinus]
MDSNLLRVFVEVAKEQSISKAAANLNFAQSNVTSRIKQLEKSINTILFYRVPKGVILSKEGEKLYPYAIEIVKKIEQANNEMKNINQQEHLIIGSTESNASTRIVPFLLELHNDFPLMSLELITNTTREITKKVLDYKVDIAFITGEPKNEELMILNKIDETIVLVEPKNETAADVFLSFKDGCAYNEFGLNYLKQNFDKEYKNLQFGNYEIILGCVKAGMGISILPLSIVKKLKYEKDLKIQKLPKSIANLPTTIVCRKDYLPRIKDYLENFKF